MPVSLLAPFGRHAIKALNTSKLDRTGDPNLQMHLRRAQTVMFLFVQLGAQSFADLMIQVSRYDSVPMRSRCLLDSTPFRTTHCVAMPPKVTAGRRGRGRTTGFEPVRVVFHSFHPFLSFCSC